MTNQLAAMQQALEALETGWPVVADLFRVDHVMKYETAITSLRTAIEQAETAQGQVADNIQRLLAWIIEECVVYPESDDEKKFANRLLSAITHPKSGYTTPPAAQPKAAQEPVHDCFWKREGYKECPAAQPAEWKGLNWDDLPEIRVGDTTFLHGAKWAEAKLKEKNA